jgi:drug/metabolite transporter (DMT)-like permease
MAKQYQHSLFIPYQQKQEGRSKGGVYSGLLAAFLLGWAPVLGKFAYKEQVKPIDLAVFRTIIAAIFLWLLYLLFWRKRILIRLQDIGSCLLVGAVNGVGSLFYYNGLGRLDASRAALLGATIPIWVVAFLSASGQKTRMITLFQLIASLIGALLVTSPWVMGNQTDYLGVMLMIASAAVNGWYFVMGQWVLSEIPSRSATLYIISGMAITVTLIKFISIPSLTVLHTPITGWYFIIILGLTTALSRMAMFFSLEKLGGAQTAIINLTELTVSLALAFVILGDRLYWYQWVGAVLLLGGGVLARIAAEHDVL